MTRTKELMKLAKAATPGPWRADGEHGYIDCVCTKTFCIASDIEKEDAAFIAACDPETIKQLVELCRLQHEAVKQYAKMMPLYQAGIDALAAFNKFEGGGVMTLVPELRRQIALLQKRIESIQDDCSHPGSAVTKTARSDTGNYDRSQDEYWNDCECLLCLKRWREKQ